MFRLNAVKLRFFIAILFVLVIGLRVDASKPMVDEDMSVDVSDISSDTEGENEKFSIPSPFSGRELESFSGSGEYISYLASEVLYIQKASIAIGSEANQTRFVQRQVLNIFKTTNSILFQSIVIAQLLPELYLDSLNFSDALIEEELLKLQESVVKPEVLKISIDVLNKRILLLVDFLKHAKKVIVKQQQLLEKYTNKLNKMPTNSFSSRIRGKCLDVIGRMLGQYSKNVILANQLLEQAKTAHINIEFLDNQLFEDTSKGALQAVVASNLAKCRRNLKFSIYQVKKYINESENCYEACNQDIDNFKEDLVNLANFLDVNRFNVYKKINCNDKLLFLSLSANKELGRIFKMLDDLFGSVASDEKARGREEFENYVYSLISIPLDFADLKKKQTIFKDSVAAVIPKMQETDEGEGIGSKLDK